MYPEISPEETDRISEPEEPVIDRAGAFLLRILKNAMVPGLLASEDDVTLAPPYQEQRDYRVGAYLYDIQDFSTMTGTAPIRLSATERQMPPKAVELRYLVFVNQSVPFSRSRAQEEQELLEAALRAFHDAGRLELSENLVGVQFSFLQLSEKVALWQSFGRPLQPAVYVTLSPVMIPSVRIRVTPEVRQVEYRYRDTPIR